MDASTTIRGILFGNKIRVPDYQRAYSWDTPSASFKGKTHTDVFLKDLENHIKSGVATTYYFGHFLFEEKERGNFDIIDGQQRLTTIVIFLSSLFNIIKKLRKFTDDEKSLFENMIFSGSNYAFSTVCYDDNFYKDYVVNQTIKSKDKAETDSSLRIAHAFDYFSKKLKNKDENYLTKMLETVVWSSCTSHLVKHESEAIQMFIFQNDRGKKPTNLEIIKAQFMYIVHLHGGDDIKQLIGEIKNRFEKIYKSIASIEHRIDEDSVLLYTLRVYYNSLWEDNSIDKINEQLNSKEPIKFIKNFSQYLEDSFSALMLFFGRDEKEHFTIHSLVTLGRLAAIMPFIIKSYIYSLSDKDKWKLFSALECLVLRHRLIGTNANIISRLNDIYQNFTEKNTNIQEICDRITWMKSEKSYFWGHWNTAHLKDAINGHIDPSTAKYILWKYENFLENNKGQNGYKPRRFDTIDSPELEHIAPKTPTKDEPVAAGYDKYDDEFVNEYIDCFGNYLLLSKSHNCVIGNRPFSEKRDSYEHLEQQREVQSLTNGTKQIWNKDKITKRHSKIIAFILENF